ncbi:DUF2087 domain-containing protein [Buchananella hordeovulneris]|uniref:DUF2087 domain-containing protein n=1 Tax=Buchananella hordeovulneris TaxID=52770 RepID=A0A1Q5PUG0_9ACTO|nr:DUF2087 domain-containing protein [Buchananella hordeovulneris]OKL51207.1 hypothetical protein BSZ40_08990 [Buchananella hordeovulneris]
MTSDKDFKKLVRARMLQTGENYTTARAALRADSAAAAAFWDKTVATFLRDDRLPHLPAKRRARVVVLIELLDLFNPGVVYSEREVSQLLAQVHDDFASLRRELVDYGLLQRADGHYQVAAQFPTPGPAVAPEIPRGAAQRFTEVTRG